MVSCHSRNFSKFSLWRYVTCDTYFWWRWSLWPSATESCCRAEPLLLDDVEHECQTAQCNSTRPILLRNISRLLWGFVNKFDSSEFSHGLDRKMHARNNEGRLEGESTYIRRGQTISVLRDCFAGQQPVNLDEIIILPLPIPNDWHWTSLCLEIVCSSWLGYTGISAKAQFSFRNIRQTDRRRISDDYNLWRI